MNMGKNRQRKRTQGSQDYLAKPRSIASLDISPTELVAILQLVEDSLGVGIWNNEGEIILATDEAKILYEKLIGVEDFIDCVMTNATTCVE